jgi:anti-sigma factor RsiW
LKVLVQRRGIVCIQAVELVTDYLEGALSRSESRRFEAHLAGCPDCTEYIAQMRATIQLTGRADSQAMTVDLQAEFVELYRRWMSE